MYDGALRGGALQGEALQRWALQGALLGVPCSAAGRSQREPSGTNFLQSDHRRGCAGLLPAPKGGSRCAVPAILAAGPPSASTSPSPAPGTPQAGRGPLSLGENCLSTHFLKLPKVVRNGAPAAQSTQTASLSLYPFHEPLQSRAKRCPSDPHLLKPRTFA